MYILIKFFRTVYQERVVFYYLKSSIKKVSQKWRECIFSNEKPKSFQGPEAGPGPRPIRAHFVCMTTSVQLAKMDKNFLGPPLAKSWIFPWDKCPSGNKVVELFSVDMVVCPCRGKVKLLCYC